MKFSLPFFKNQSAGGAARFGFSGFTRDEALSWGIVCLIALLGTLLLWDVFLFFESRKTPALLLPSLQPKQRITVQDIDQTIQLLDEREAVFQKILDSATPSP